MFKNDRMLFCDLDPEEAFGKPIIVRGFLGIFPKAPADPHTIDETQWPRYGVRETYLHVYGKFKCVVVDIKNQNAAGVYLSQTKIRQLCDEMVSNTGKPLNMVGGKVIYKYPSMYAM